MDQSKETSSETRGMELTPESISYLETIRKWAFFLSIIGFIVIGLMLIVAIITATVSIPFSGFQSGGGIAATVLFIILTVIYFFPVFFLFKFASISKLALEQKDSNRMEEALRYHKMLFRFLGIIAIIFLCIYVIGIIAAMVGSLFFGG